MKQKKKIQVLVQLSQTDGILDPRKIGAVAETLTAAELSLYYKALARKRAEEKVIVTTAIPMPADVGERLQKLFPRHDFVFTQDSSLLAGMKVAMADFIFNATLREHLNKIGSMYAQ